MTILIYFFAFNSHAKIGDQEKYAALVIDLDSGETLFSEHAEDKRYPASLTKLMTAYLTFEAIGQGKISLNSMFKVSKKASMQPQTKIGFKEGEKVSVKNLLEALAVRSANDAALILAENLEGSEMHFALAMTQKGRELGLKNTIFTNSSGLPDRRQYTTALDIAILSEALLKKFPEYYYIFGKYKFYNHFDEFSSHNPVLTCYPGASGLKTGFINDSGFNLITIANNGNKNIMAVVLGGETSLERDKYMVRLLDEYLNERAVLVPVLPEYEPVCGKLAAP